MKIERFKAANVHGYLNYEINFDERLTFLIGINGTGKTSVLKLILGLISPSFRYLNSIDFDSAELFCISQTSESVSITATSVSELDIELILKAGVGQPLRGKFSRYNPALYSTVDGEESEKQRAEIDFFDQLEVVQRIKSLATPLFLGLDRRVYEGQQIDKFRLNYIYKKRYRHFMTNDPLNIGLMDIQEVIFDYVREIASEQPEINNRFKNQILLQSFEFLDSQHLNPVNKTRELAEKRKKAIAAFENLRILGFTEHINNFFDQLEDVAQQIRNVRTSEQRDIESEAESIQLAKENIHLYQKWFNNQPQLKRINELIDFNAAYQSEIEQLYEPLEKTKSIVNSFFSESKKELMIDPKGELSVKFKSGKVAKIFELSSGEKQIVTMLGHLIYFGERFKSEPGIFIIDEPELSLHLAWQEIFVSSILEASPTTQFILATHSPSIIGDAPASMCQDLGEAN